MLGCEMVLVDVSGGKSLIASWALKHSIWHNCGFRDNFFGNNIAFRQKVTSDNRHLVVGHFLTYALLLCCADFTRMIPS
jgi:hypothetical protein